MNYDFQILRCLQMFLVVFVVLKLVLSADVPRGCCSCLKTLCCLQMFLVVVTVVLKSCVVCRCSSVNDKECFVPRMTSQRSNMSDFSAALQNRTDVDGQNGTLEGEQFDRFLPVVGYCIHIEC